MYLSFFGGAIEYDLDGNDDLDGITEKRTLLERRRLWLT